MLYNSIYTIIYFALSLHKYIFKMGYKAKIQRVDRGATKSFYCVDKLIWQHIYIFIIFG